jgi:hypothetical protein
MDRRSFVGGLAAAGAASSIFHRIARAQSAPKVRNIVLVHGCLLTGRPGPKSSLGCKRWE